MKDFGNELLTKVRRIVRSYCRAAVDQVRQEWTAVNNVDGNAKIKEEKLEVAQDTVARAIVATGQKAWIAEYGKGSEMDKSTSENPFLEDYLNSNIFNRERIGHALAVVGRPRGTYTDLDGKEHFSYGTLKGVEIETWYGQPLMTPISGKHIIQHVLDDLMPQMQEEIQGACSDVLIELLARFPKEIKIAK